MKRALKSKPLWVIVGLALVFIISAIVLQAVSDSWNSDDYLFAARWSLDELQSYFTGTLPADANDIVYQPGPATGLLNFKSSPETATEFANRFCAGLRYQGYDPFNAQDKVAQSVGYLIKTERDSFFYSASPNTPSTYFGNRCFEYARGGNNQILLDQTDPHTYKVKLQIAGTCNNLTAEYRCWGIFIDYIDRGTLVVNAAPRTITAHYAQGDSWRILVTPNASYEILITPLSHEEQATYVNITTLPLDNVSAPYCEKCWLDTRGFIGADGFKATFEGSPTSRSKIQLFWMNSSKTTFSLQIRPVEN